MENIQNRIRRAYQSGFDAGHKRGIQGEKYPNGVDWHIIGTKCVNCGLSEVLPVADDAGEDINLFEKMSELKKDGCGNCSKPYRVFYEDGQMASKKDGWKRKED